MPLQVVLCCLRVQAEINSSNHFIVQHPPEEAGEFPGNGRLGDICFLAPEEHAIVFTSETLVGSVCVCNDLRWVSLLSGLQHRGFIAYLSPPVALGGFNQYLPHVGIARFCDAQTVLPSTAGILSGNEAESP